MIQLAQQLKESFKPHQKSLKLPLGIFPDPPSAICSRICGRLSLQRLLILLRVEIGSKGRPFVVRKHWPSSRYRLKERILLDSFKFLWRNIHIDLFEIITK